MKKINDIFNELDDNLKNAIKRVENLKIDELDFKEDMRNHLSNINKMGLKKECNLSDFDISEFQKCLRIQKLLYDESIKLVGIDISRTIVEYCNNDNLKLISAKLIKEKYNKYFTVSEEYIVKTFEKGFSDYHKFRLKEHIELNEIFVYKNYILNKIINIEEINDDYILDIINIWKTNSVDLTLNTTKLYEIIKYLKERNIIVVTISDMLGEMSKYALKKLKIYDLFDAHFCSNDFHVRKSNVKNSLYQIACRFYKLSSHNCLMIGNDVNDDIKASINNGWKSIYTSYGKNIDYENKNLLYKLDNLDELYKLIVNNKINIFPKLNKTKYFLDNNATRDNDTNTYNLNAYFIRQKAKSISNRNLREYLYRNYLIKNCGIGVRIGNNVEIRYPNNIYIGNNCQINDNVTILNEAPVIIGNNVMIAANLFMSTHKHDWRLGMIQNNIESWKKGNTSLHPISIENNCWIGPNCVFESDTYISHHSIICANSVVKSGVYPPYSLIGGTPAKIIKNIKGDLDIQKIVSGEQYE